MQHLQIAAHHFISVAHLKKENWMGMGCDDLESFFFHIEFLFM